MTIEEYINDNRAELLATMQELCPNNTHTHDEEIELWIMDDPGMYYAAKDAGVDECQEED